MFDQKALTEDNNGVIDLGTFENESINIKIELLDEVLNSSIEFDVKKHRFLWIRQYYGNKKIYLDLSKKDKDMMEQLFIEEEKVYNDDYDMDKGW